MIISLKYKKIIIITILIAAAGSYWLCSNQAGLDQGKLVKKWLSKIQTAQADFFTTDPEKIKTPELKLFSENDQEITKSFSEKRIADILELRNSIASTTNSNLFGLIASAADSQTDFLDTLLKTPYNSHDQNEENVTLPLLNRLKDKGNIQTYYDRQDQVAREAIPTITSRNGGLTTIATPYTAIIPVQSAAALDLNQIDGNNETKLTLTSKTTNSVSPIIYDNKALYKDIQQGIDGIITANNDGLSQSLIIKAPTALQIKDNAGILNLTYDLTWDGAKPQLENGALVLVDKNNIKQYIITPPTIIDANNKKTAEAKFSLLGDDMPIEPEIIPLSFIDKIKRFFSIPSVLAENKPAKIYQVQLTSTINANAVFPLLLTYDLLPTLTRYVDSTANKTAAKTDYLLDYFGQTLPPTARELLASTGIISQSKIKTLTSTDSFVSEMALPEEGKEDRPLYESGMKGGFEDNTPQTMGLRTEFDTLDDQVRQNISLKSGRDMTGFKLSLINASGYRQEIYQGESGDTKVYFGQNDIITYTQTVASTTGEPVIKLKEVIYATTPNQTDGRSIYIWQFSPQKENSNLILEPQADGSVKVYEEMQITGIDLNDKAKRQHIMDVVKRALSNTTIENKKVIAVLEPLVYVTNDGIKKTINYQIEDNKLIIDIQENANSYPLIIDPTFIWLQWLGGIKQGSDTIKAVAININEIYVVGYTNSNISFSSASSTGGTHSGGTEGFVVELADNEGAAPTLNWLQWLGGTGYDYVYALAMSGDEIYVGGYADSATSWESASSTGGTHSGGTEGFVVELADNEGAAPTLNWLQWLGGTSWDEIEDLAVSGDEIYVGGYADSATSWESASSTGGTHSGDSEAFVVELYDNAGAAPTLNWLQWLGGTSEDYVNDLAVLGDEIYVGGFAFSATSWESASSTGGTYSGGYEVFVVELADNEGAAPTLNWLQWLGGNGVDYIYALAVFGDEIYVGGSADRAISWESVSFIGGTHIEDYVKTGFVVELADNEGAAPTLNWLQWLGGTSEDHVYGLAVSGDEIYVCGEAYSTTSWESVSFTGGTHTGDSEGFVVELYDNEGAVPTLNWLQWLGGISYDDVSALAVSGEEVYVGGFSYDIIDWESVSFTGGTYSGQTEGFVVELVDNEGAAPTLNWLQWLGGTSEGTDEIKTIAVNNNEIYIGGYSNSNDSFSVVSYTCGNFSGSREGFVVELQDNVSAAPTLNWLQWLGGIGNDYVNALAVSGDEIYVGGSARYDTSWESASSTGGTHSGQTEGFVVELTDNEGAVPTLNWLQWLGGTSLDEINALAVSGEEIYAGGSAWGATSWESASSTGGIHSGSYEGFVVELADNEGAAPTLNWLQWLGGTGSDQVYTLAVFGEEIYAGGLAYSATSWESASYTGGIYAGDTEGFVVELADNEGAAPTLNWLQWLGGSGVDYIYDLAVSGDEIYVGGHADSATPWESASSTGGTHSGGSEGFVVELADNEGAAPTLNWLQWLGGTGSDHVYDLAVSGDEIYVVGEAYSPTSWESVSAAGGTYSGGSEGFVVELADNEGAVPTLNWLQWLGGTGYDYVYALAVSGDEIYVGGSVNSATDWDSAIYTGSSYIGDYEGTIIKLIDHFDVNIIMPANNIITTNYKFSYSLSQTVIRATTTFTRTGGAPDAAPPHVCVLQGTALDNGTHNNLELTADANACTTDFATLSPDTIYSVTLETETSLGGLASDTNTNITYYHASPKTIFKRNVKLKENIIIKQ